MDSKPISVVFVTHNRKELLHRAILAVKAQSVPVEVIVMDDASTDGTDKMLQTEFPDVLYTRSAESLGPAYQRTEGGKKATSDIIVFLDDDTLVEDQYIIQNTIEDFDQPCVGAVAIPFINIMQDNQVHTAAPDKKELYLLHSFVAASFAVRREIFLQLGGFRKEYFYMGEEGDFCIRLLEAGYFVKAGTSAPAHHYQPANRVSFSADFYGRRNDIFFLYLNSPRKYLVPSMAVTILKGLWFGFKVGRIGNMYKGIVAGLGSMVKPNYGNIKKPIKSNVYLKYRYLKKNEPLPLTKLSL